MEVHHHAHTSRKKWTHYFWEFLMLFLAVLCGFMAENFREHKIELKRAKQFAISLINDLKTDTGTCKVVTDIREKKQTQLTILMEELEKKQDEQNDSLIFHLANAVLLRRSYFTARIGTYQQIKSSGSLRYFEEKIGAGLVNYEVEQQILDKALAVEDKFATDNLIRLRNAICNPVEIRREKENPVPHIRHSVNKDPQLQHELYGALVYLFERNEIYIRLLYETQGSSSRIINELKKQYHIK